MAKYRFYSNRHDRSVKLEIKGHCSGPDPVAILTEQVRTRGPDRIYAKHVLARIKKEICGQPDCNCGVFTVAL